MLRQRVITALVLVVVLAWADFFWSSLYFSGLILLVALVAAYEWTALQGLSGGPQWAATLALTALSGVAVFGLDSAALGVLSVIVLAVWVALVIWLFRVDRAAAVLTPQPWRGWLAVVLLPTVSALLVALHAVGPWLLLYVLAIAWSADIGAYFVGKRFGHRKLAPNVSPGKSIEGFAGGVVCALGLALLSLAVFDVAAASPISWISASVVAAVLSVAGDLFESTLKRAAQVKDSGTILPGHGGVLDRVDSLLAAVPAFVALAPAVLR
ncbi:MAG: phosphatidate cytidylyltransferase [Pseudomonadota bacterium]